MQGTSAPSNAEQDLFIPLLLASGCEHCCCKTVQVDPKLGPRAHSPLAAAAFKLYLASETRANKPSWIPTPEPARRV